MNIDYEEWLPCAALNGVILAYWRVAGDGSAVPSPAILPDAYMGIVINLGSAVTLNRAAFSGRQPTRAVVGLLESTHMHPGQGSEPTLSRKLAMTIGSTGSLAVRISCTVCHADQKTMASIPTASCTIRSWRASLLG